MSWHKRALIALALGASLGGCELIARFDDSRLDAGDGSTVRMDAALEAAAEASTEAGADAGAEVADSAAPDAAMDASIEAGADAATSD